MRRTLVAAVGAAFVFAVAGCGGNGTAKSSPAAKPRRATNSAETLVRPCLLEQGFRTRPTAKDNVVAVDIVGEGVPKPVPIAVIAFFTTELDAANAAASMSNQGLVPQLVQTAAIGFHEQLAEQVPPIVDCVAQVT
jgi:hypothetical protein